MEQEARKQDGPGLGWGSMLPLPRSRADHEVGVAKAKAQGKGQEAARREAELQEHGAAELHRRYAEAAQAEGGMGRKRELQHEAGIAA